MTETLLREATAFSNTPAYKALTEQQKTTYVRNDAVGFGYAWGRLDQGHPAIVSLSKIPDLGIRPAQPSTTDTAWAFGSLYAQMLLELHSPVHPRTSGFSVQGAWDIFAKTGCPEGHLPHRLS
ncbi:hypothetical protein [Cryobacterium zhongshanensis]|uniref:Uncharacterized protein n=1 Tax=Cryobacterium zhongshanensis TaxID=2928153 RepID=A0AA41QXZ2_9MICO|nr:hypothetical protein [Cryobacterium zhongshanensis]MCI4659771.1 hypothetical protein [Cryobacterium zhongshanensis]